jgi:hypothetical protein
MPSPNLPAPLSATITKATVTLGGQSATHTFANPVQAYVGDQLFCRATSDGTILTITIDQTGPNTPPPALGATIASITMSYNATPTPEHWDMQNIAYQGGATIALGLQLDPTWASATVSINDAVQTSSEAQLNYVLVRDDADPSTGEQAHYDLYWLATVALFDADKITGATFIPDGGGGMSGPFGISLP